MKEQSPVVRLYTFNSACRASWMCALECICMLRIVLAEPETPCIFAGCLKGCRTLTLEYEKKERSPVVRLYTSNSACRASWMCALEQQKEERLPVVRLYVSNTALSALWTRARRAVIRAQQCPECIVGTCSCLSLRKFLSGFSWLRYRAVHLRNIFTELLRLHVQKCTGEHIDGTLSAVRKRRSAYGIQMLAHSLVRGGSQIDTCK